MEKRHSISIATYVALAAAGFVMVTLTCLGQATAAQPTTADSSAVIDWAKGDNQDTPASCGAFTFTHMADRHSYNLYVRGKNSGTCSFRADGLTFRFPSNHGPTIQGTTTIYSFVRFGSDVVIAWTPGY
jgi:hypothetical protein